MNLYIVIILMMLLAFSMIYENSDASIDDVLNSTGTLEETLFNLSSETLPYTSHYNQDPTIKTIVYNIANSFFYSMAVMLNTIIPLTAYAAGGEFANILVKVLIIFLSIYIFFKIHKLIGSIIIFYFFIKEKRKSKVRWYK